MENQHCPLKEWQTEDCPIIAVAKAGRCGHLLFPVLSPEIMCMEIGEYTRSKEGCDSDEFMGNRLKLSLAGQPVMEGRSRRSIAHEQRRNENKGPGDYPKGRNTITYRRTLAERGIQQCTTFDFLT
jgi:hypothetical protein